MPAAQMKSLAEPNPILPAAADLKVNRALLMQQLQSSLEMARALRLPRPSGLRSQEWRGRIPKMGVVTALVRRRRRRLRAIIIVHIGRLASASNTRRHHARCAPNINMRSKIA